MAVELTSTAATTSGGPRSQAAGHCARDSSAAAASTRDELPGHERGAAVVGRHVVAQPLPGDDRVLVVAEHLLEAGDRRREPLRLLADGRRDRLGRVPAALGADPHRVQVVVGRVVVERVDGVAELPPRLGDEVAELELEVVRPRPTGAPSAPRRRAGRAARGSGRSACPRAARRAVARARRGGRRAAARPATASISGVLLDLAGQPLEEHLGVAHRAEQAAQPLQLVAERLVPLRVERPAERAQVGAQAAGRDARLVDASGSSPRRTPGSWARSARSSARSRRGRRRWAWTRSRAHPAGRGRTRRARAARGHGRSSTGVRARRRRRLPGAARSTPRSRTTPPRRTRPRARGSRFDVAAVDGTETSSSTTSATDLAVGVAEHEAVADGVDVRGQLERCAPHERGHEVDARRPAGRRARRRRASSARTSATSALLGQLHRPALGSRYRRLAPARARRRSAVS